MSLYSEDTVFVQGPDKPDVTGLPNLRALLLEFLAYEPTLSVELKQFVQADDIAFFSVRWILRGTDPATGEPVDDDVRGRQRREAATRWLSGRPLHRQPVPRGVPEELTSRGITAVVETMYDGFAAGDIARAVDRRAPGRRVDRDVPLQKGSTGGGTPCSHSSSGCPRISTSTTCRSTSGSSTASRRRAGPLSRSSQGPVQRGVRIALRPSVLGRGRQGRQVRAGVRPEDRAPRPLTGSEPCAIRAGWLPLPGEMRRFLAALGS